MKNKEFGNWKHDIKYLEIKSFNFIRKPATLRVAINVWLA